MNADRIVLSNGKRDLTLNELGSVQPGMDRLMHEIGQRAWRLYYAATHENWPLADYFRRTLTKMLAMSAFVRPRYSEAMEQFIADCFTPIKNAIEAEDCDAFEVAWEAMVMEANRWHVAYGFDYIVWKTPSVLPPDLNVNPQPERAPRSRIRAVSNDRILPA
jgi:hypothetical protein